MAAPKKVLFVCVGNSCRSQMAEALARHSASDVIAAASAGLSPLGHIEATTLAALKEKGITAHRQYSKGLFDKTLFRPDLIVNMSGIPSRSLFPADAVLDWQVGDPYGENLVTYRRICDDIEARVKALAEELRAEAKHHAKRKA